MSVKEVQFAELILLTWWLHFGRLAEPSAKSCAWNAEEAGEDGAIFSGKAFLKSQLLG